MGNGIDWKIGVFDTIIGYEVTDAGSNPNYTRSWGYAIEPTEHTGILGTYTINSDWSISAGIANTLMAGINTRTFGAQDFEYTQSDWHKAFMGSLTFTAPSSWSWAAGSSFYAGVVYGFNDAPNQEADEGGFHSGGDQANYYFGATLNTPLKQLTVGTAFDYAHNFGGGGNWALGYHELDMLVAGLYATYKATDKLSFNGRGEYIYGNESVNNFFSSSSYTADGYELTGTVEYDLWANVVSRIEVRWDHDNTNVNPFDPANEADSIYVENKDAVGLYANVIYKF